MRAEFSKLVDLIEKCRRDRLPKNYQKINFTPPEIQTGKLDPETPYKFIRIYSYPIKKGVYGPFYRYTPNQDNLEADNYLGGYFTDTRISCCVGCVKIKLWLFDRDKRYFYKNREKLFRHRCYFKIEDDKYSTVFLGTVAYGKCVQIRPNNWIFGNDTERRNGIYFKSDAKKNKLTNKCCSKIRSKSFFRIFEK